MASPHAVFINVSATGHMNPTLPLVKALCSQGYKVTYFVPEAMRSVVEAAGADWKPTYDMLEPPLEVLQDFGLAPDAPKEEYEFPKYVLPISAKFLPSLLAELKALEPSPSVIIYDPFLVEGLVASKVLGLPAVGMVTVPGPGTMAKPGRMVEDWEASPLVQNAHKQILDNYGCDVFQQSLLMEFYSPELNIVTTIDGIFAPPSSDLQIQRIGHLNNWRCVGPIIDLSVKRIAHARATKDAASDLPWHTIDAEARAGKRVLYISMGTVANSFFYEKILGDQGRENGTQDLTGKAFLQHVFSRMFEALGQDQEVVVIMATGPNSDVLSGLPATPPNFILRETIPQLEVLSKCHGFITHGGANSMHEALGFGVPMVVVPVFGDQPTNGDSVARSGAGFSFRRPLESLTAEALRTAVATILDPEKSNSYRAAAQDLMRRAKEAGGAVAAAKAINSLVAEKAAKQGGA